MSKLYFADQSSCQTRCNSIHAALIAASPVYAASVAAGQTLRWAIPMQDLGANKQPVDSRWWIAIDSRCMGVLTALEIASLTI